MEVIKIKTYKNLYAKMLNKQHLEKSIYLMMRRKHNKYIPGTVTQKINSNIDYFVRELYKILSSKGFKSSKTNNFERLERNSQKVRNIEAPKIFPDQAVHWSVILILQPIFMKSMDPFCCASIPGRGPEYARKYIERKLDVKRHPENKTKYKYYLQCDIQKFFQNISRKILIDKLSEIIKDKDMMDIISNIIYYNKGNIGIPLGFYTSQWFANFYLQEFDHYVREQLFPKYRCKNIYIRYMDDIIIMGSNKRKLENIFKDMCQFLEERLSLKFKDNFIINSFDNNMMDFIGYQFTYNKTIIRNRNYRKIADINNSLEHNKFNRHNLSSFISLYGYVEHSDVYNYSSKYLISKNIIIKYGKLFNEKYIRCLNKNVIRNRVKILQEIKRLKQKCTDEESSVLVIYSPKDNKVKVVSRSYIFVPNDNNLSPEFINSLYLEDGSINYLNDFWQIK